MRVVLDTNIIISAVISPHGTPAKIIKAWQDRKFQLLISIEIFREIACVLERPRLKKYNITDLRRKEILKVLYKYSVMTQGKLNVKVSEDSNDDKFIVCAMEGNADYIVSGDIDLLKIKSHKNIDIITADAFIKILERS